MDGLTRRAACNRRSFTLGITSLMLLPQARAGAQSTKGLPKVAILSPSTPEHAKTPGTPPYSFVLGLTELGYLDGKNIALEFRFANNALERLPALAAELVDIHPDVIFTFTSGGARAAASATSTIPIVVGPVIEATMIELVKDIAHPAGNVTGATVNSLGQHEKCLQLLKETVPQITRVGVLLNPLNPAWNDYPAVLNEAARTVGVEVIRAEARGVPELDQAFGAMATQGVDGLFALNDSSLAGAVPVPKRLFELIDSHRLPSASDAAPFAREGGLLALGTDFAAIGHRGAFYVHRLLQGAKPSELPVELPTEFKLIVNLKAADALGIVVPPAIIAGADEVIE